MHRYIFVVEPYGDGWGFGMEGRKVLYHHSESENVLKVGINLVRNQRGVLRVKDAAGKCILETDYAEALEHGEGLATTQASA